MCWTVCGRTPPISLLSIKESVFFAERKTSQISICAKEKSRCVSGSNLYSIVNPIFRFGLLFSSAIFSIFGLPNNCQIVAPAALPIAATIDMVNVINIWVEFPMLSFTLSPPIKATAFSAETKKKPRHQQAPRLSCKYQEKESRSFDGLVSWFLSHLSFVGRLHFPVLCFRSDRTYFVQRNN